MARAVTSGASVDGDAVIAARGLGRDIALAHVALDAGGGAATRRTPAATAASHEVHDLAGGNGMLGRLAHLALRSIGRGDLDPVHRAVEPAVDAPGGRGL